MSENEKKTFEVEKDPYAGALSLDPYNKYCKAVGMQANRYTTIFYWRNMIMAKTKSGKKIVRVGGYTKSSGGKVKSNCRSTPSKR